MANASTKKRLEDILTCCLCFELYNTTQKVPKALPCQHTFCAPCLAKYMQTADENGQEYKCPMCKEKFAFPCRVRGVSDLRTNFSVMDMLELKISGEKNNDKYPRCDLHLGKQSMFVCMDCFVGLCAECLKFLSKGAHCEHTIEERETVMTDTTLIQGFLDDQNEHMDTLERHITETHERLTTILQMKQKDLMMEVDNNAELAHELICTNEDKLSRFAHPDLYEKVNTAHQRVRNWQRTTKSKVKEILHSKLISLKRKTSDFQKQSDAIKVKLKHAKECSSFQKLACIELTESLISTRRNLHSQQLKFEQITSEWEPKVSTKCDADLTLPKYRPSHQKLVDRPILPYKIQDEWKYFLLLVSIIMCLFILQTVVVSLANTYRDYLM